MGLFHAKKENADSQKGVPNQMDTVNGETTVCDYTMDDLQMVTRDIEKQKRRRRRRVHKDANLIRLNLRKRLTMNDTTHYADVVGKQQPLNLEQDAADEMFAKNLAECIHEFEEEDFQSRARFTHLKYSQYYSKWKNNGEYHKNLMKMYNDCDVGLPKDKDKTRSRTSTK